LNTVFKGKNWARSCYVTWSNNNNNKKKQDLASKRFRVHSVLKMSTLEGRFKKLRIRMPDSPNTYGRKQYPERKICGFKNIRIRVEGPSVACHIITFQQRATVLFWCFLMFRKFLLRPIVLWRGLFSCNFDYTFCNIKEMKTF